MISRRFSPGACVLALGWLAVAPALASEKANAPVPAATVALMQARNMAASAPILIRTFKKEAVLEVWKQNRAGRYALLKSFPICRWSGQLGPKRKQGDRQTPEGFYSISPRQMNPNSAYYLSFDTGFPNAYDKAHNSTGSALMVHGTCSSAGCYAMTDKQIAEIYALARDALAAGQAAFQFQAYPFRMSAENMAKYRSDPNIAFWQQLKDGSDRFEATMEEPKVSVTGGRYVFNYGSPDKEAVASAHHAQEQAKVATLVSEGGAAIKTTYSDGGQHAIFAALARQGTDLGDISRPEALAFAGRDVVITPARAKVQIARVVRPAAQPQVATAVAVVAAPSPAVPDVSSTVKPAAVTTVSPFDLTLIPGSAPILETRFSGKLLTLVARQ